MYLYACAPAFPRLWGSAGHMAIKCTLSPSPNFSVLILGAFTFNEHEEKTFDEMWCCPLQDAVCCSDISCCFPNYPVCCPGNTCCATEYPVCCPNHVCCSVDNPQCCGNTCCPQSMRCVHGQCVQKDGTVAPGVPATPKVYGLTPEYDKVTTV